MNKKQRLAKGRKEPKHLRDEKANKKIKARRDFCYKAGIVVAFAGLGGSTALCWLNKKEESVQNSYISWGFLDSGKTISHPTEADLIGAVPLWKPTSLEPGSVECKEVFDLLHQRAIDEIAQRGFDQSGDYNFFIDDSPFARLLPESQAENLKKYIDRAVEYLCGQISGLSPISWKSETMSERGNYTRGFQNKALIGDSLLRKRVVTVENSRNPDEVVHLTGIYQNEGSRALFDHDSEGKVDTNKWRIFFGAGPSAILAPFSEVLPITTIARLDDYKEELGEEIADIAQEAITEALAQKLIQGLKISIPDLERRLEIVRRRWYGGNRKYSKVDEGLRFVEEYGLQRSLDFFMERRPQEFMDKLSTYE